MRVFSASAATLTAAALLLACPAAALTPLSGSTQIRTHAFVNHLASTVTQTDVGGWLGAPRNETVFARSEAHHVTADLGDSSAVATGFNIADWSPDGLSGSVTFSWRWGFFQLGGEGPLDRALKGAAFDELNPNWSYTFRADRDGVFRWEGQIRPSRDVVDNNLFGLSGWNLKLNGVTVIDLYDVAASGPRTGDADFGLVAGETYTFSLVNSSNIAGSNFGREYRGALRGDFNWEIVERPAAPVPEPGVWSLMITGFGLAGATLRRRPRSLGTTP